MKIFFKKLSKKNFFWIILLFLLALPTFWRILTPGHFPIHDDLQVGRLYQMNLCWRDGQIPCRWVPDMGYGYGYPLFNFYPPLPYYLGQIFIFLGFSYLNSAKLLFILALFFSGFFAYLLGKELWGKYGGWVTATFYLYLPYHAVDVYVRGAMNEFLGLVFFPALFWLVLKIIKENKKIFIAVLAFFISLILLSHNLMSFFIMPFLGFWALFLIWYFKKPIKKLWLLFYAGLWGLCLSAFFTLPVIFEQHFVHLETMFIGYFNYLAHFANLDQLFFSRFWGYGASVWGPDDGLSFSLGHLHWLMGLAALMIFTRLYLKRRQKEFYLVILFFFFFLITAFLSHQRSSFLWEAFPILANMQFPWRFVGLSGFFITLISGSILILVKKQKKALILTVFLIMAVILTNFSFFRPEKIIKITDEEKLFSAEGWSRLQTDAIFDYLPIYASLPPSSPAPEQPYFIRGEGGEIKNWQKGTNWQKFEVEVAGESLLQLPLYYFPGWQVLVNGEQIEINYENDLGLMTIKLGEGNYQVEARLKNTPVRKVSNYLSLIAWLGLLGFLFVRIKKKYGKI